LHPLLRTTAHKPRRLKAAFCEGFRVFEVVKIFEKRIWNIEKKLLPLQPQNEKTFFVKMSG